MTDSVSQAGPASTSLASFGYSPIFADRFAAVADRRPHHSLQPGRIVFQSHELYRVATADGIRKARISGQLRSSSSLPVVGDWIALRALGEAGEAQITDVLPRSSRLSRKAAGKETIEQVVTANIDTVFIVMGLDGDYNLRRLERFAVMVWESGAQPVAILTKADLHEDVAGARLDAQAAAPGMPVFSVVATVGSGLEPLRAFLEPGRTVVLVGSSGAGKSTLLNRLYGAEVMKTSAVRAGDDRGRHTTTHRQLVRLPGGCLLVDNPGIREIQPWAAEDALNEAFEDLQALARSCRFGDCRHLSEPGCAVLAAIDDGRIESERLESWRGLEKELEHLERKRDVASSRRADRRLGKYYKRVLAEKKGRR